MQIDIVFPVLPPVVDGIGDHTAHLSRALAEHADVRVLTAQEEYVPIPGVRVEQGFTIDRRSGVLRLIGAVRARKPDWVFLQFNQFSYGRWGLNPYLAHTIRRTKDQSPGTRVAWMVHEDFMPATSIKKAIMSTWQRTQFRQLGNAADVIFFSIEPWVEKYASWFPDARCEHLPVGSNIPDLGVARAEAKRAAGIDEDAIVVGFFGTMHGSRLREPLKRAIAAVADVSEKTVVLYVGPDGVGLRELLNGVAVIDAGALPPSEVSRRLAAMDMSATAFMDGVSTRRGSFMAGLQHGVATVTNSGTHTGSLIRAEAGRGVLLSPTEDEAAFVENARRVASDQSLRFSLSSAGRKFYYESFDWAVVARRAWETMAAA